ncbi:hypothetical protein RFI_32942 [Reticulomyxa filosa]|uniref:Transmembrane protein n=1 Tax=Reticulomyxa filosa TaxID=46433 RepID=X6LUR6_RETFI|nr:hypothetical protein RFI_32942 [Reticulomyxa filosa]|eukprot:ETO04455.1 hypothetical protein RFI_32942 [Reticulomyxa filosa]
MKNSAVSLFTEIFMFFFTFFLMCVENIDTYLHLDGLKPSSQYNSLLLVFFLLFLNFVAIISILITYQLKNISVFDLNTFQFIKHYTLPTNNIIFYHFLVSNSENGQGQQMMKTNQQNYQILLFCFKTGLSIEYDENNNTFQFHNHNIASLYKYAYYWRI